MNWKYKGLLFLLLLCISFSANAQLKILYKCGEPTLETPIIKPYINIINVGDYGIELKDITVRYYYSRNRSSGERFQIEYAVIGGSQIKITFHEYYAEIIFIDDKLVVPPGGETGEIKIKINKNDWTNYDQADDFSFNPTFKEYKEFSKILILYKGNTIWGGVPSINPSPSPI